jgi:hypothetical protein
LWTPTLAAGSSSSGFRGRGRGRSGGYRTLMAYRVRTRAVFLYGFAKSERDNIGPDELEYWRKIARGFLGVNDAQLGTMIEERELAEVDCDDEEENENED